VQISLDGVPFLFHDSTLFRTSNIEKVYPKIARVPAVSLTMKQLNQLEVGSSFVKRDPFGTIEHSEVVKKHLHKFTHQKIPTLLEFLQFTAPFGRSLIFDLYPSEYYPLNHPFRNSYLNRTLEVILNSSYPQENIWWMSPRSREMVARLAPRMKQTRRLSGQEVLFLGGKKGQQRVYFKLSELEAGKIRIINAPLSLDDNLLIALLRKPVHVNLWTIDSEFVYSYFWCLGVQSVTTNRCDVLSELANPSFGYYSVWAYLLICSLIEVFSLSVLGLQLWVLKKARRTM